MNLQVRTFHMVFLVCSLVMLSGCDWFRSEKKVHEQTSDQVIIESSSLVPLGDTSKVIVSIDGKPGLTVDMVEKEKERIFAAQPHMRTMLPFIDEKQLNQQLAEGMLTQMVINKYVEDQGIDKTAKYKDDYDHMLKNIQATLNVQHLIDALGVTIADKEIEKYYDEHKDSMDELMISRGGVKALGIQFDDEAKAKEFEAKVQEAQGDISKVAKEMGLEDKLQDFKLVNEMSLAIDKTVKDAILAIETLPETQLIKVEDKDFWVVRATEREEKKYRPLDENVREGLREMLVNEKKQDQIQEKIKLLRDEYKVELNEEYFTPTQPSDQFQAMNEMDMNDILVQNDIDQMNDQL